MVMFILYYLYSNIMAQNITYHPEPGMHPTAPPTPPTVPLVQYQATRPIHTQGDKLFLRRETRLPSPFKHRNILKSVFLGIAFFVPVFTSFQYQL